MKKRTILGALLLVTMAMTGCGEAEDKQTTEVAQVESTTEKAEQEDATTEEVSTTEEEAATEEQTEDAGNESEGTGLTQYASNYGHYISYNADLFEVVMDEGSDCVQLKGQDVEKDIPVYVSFIQTADTAENVLQGVILQASQDGITPNESVMGKNDYPSNSIYYEVETERGTECMTMHVVEAEGMVYLVEICTGKDVDMEVSNAIEEILASFEVEK